MSRLVVNLPREQFERARAYSDERGVDIRNACLALGFIKPQASQPSAAGEPLASAATPAVLTKTEMVERARAHAKEHGLGFAAAFRVLGFEAAYNVAPHAPPPSAAAAPVRSERRAQADRVAVYAREHGVDFVTAYKLLGFDGEKSAAQARARVNVQRARAHAEKHGTGLAAALKAVGGAR